MLSMELYSKHFRHSFSLSLSLSLSLPLKISSIFFDFFDFRHLIDNHATMLEYKKEEFFKFIFVVQTQKPRHTLSCWAMSISVEFLSKMDDNSTNSTSDCVIV